MLCGWLLLFFPGILAARHIIGGVITYKCLGAGQQANTNRYEFTMKMYRDCSCTNCANFDSSPQGDRAATVTIYVGTSRTPFGTLSLPQPTITNIQPNVDNPCLILPPNVCVEEGIYTWTMNLPIIAESYHITYQRCCRNVTISNIQEPQNSGATFTIELTPEAQAGCNNSPVFNLFPPIVICAGEPLRFDHSATDPDGDQLVYEFCSPLLGGGTGGATSPGDPAGFSGVAPDPDAPPPYDPVRFIVPRYSALTPIAGNPLVVIDPNTGRITGTPTTLGQFVVGVCVSEFRNGKLLSKVFRDFQFNVANCEPTVEADILEDVQLGAKAFLVNACGNRTVTFKNESVQRQFINFFQWKFDIQGQSRTFNTWDATITFPDTGLYRGQLILNPSTECGDTADIFVRVLPELVANFSFEYDTCRPNPVQFMDESYSEIDDIRRWRWNFADGDTSALMDPEHFFTTPGNKPVTLEIWDGNMCSDDTTRIVSYYPVPADIIIAPSTFDGCIPANIFFDNLSTPIDDTYDIRWDFGDGSTGDAISPTHIYNDPGVYTVAISIVSPVGCETDTIFHDLIRVQPSPVADFTYFPEQPSNLAPTVTFTDQSVDAVRWAWDLGGFGNSSQPSPVFSFPDTGKHEVTLIVTHANGCKDTTIQIVDVIPEVRYFLPNAFTPNSDDINDFYRGNGMMAGATNFHFTVWNRWGELLFESTDPEEAWNGRKGNTGGQVPNGVYVVLVTFTGPRGEKHEVKGFATLIR